MKKLLRIDSSVRKEGSHSRALADVFQARWLQANPDGKVILRDLADTPIPHLDNATIAAFGAAGDLEVSPASEAVSLSNVLIAELKSADHVLVSSPLYNFMAPSTLKAWVDHVVRFGQTFTVKDGVYSGLLHGKSVCIVTSRGGLGTGSDPAALDFQGPYLQAVFAFMGFERMDWIPLEGTSAADGRLDERMARATAQIARLEYLQASDETDDGVQWLGSFSAQDRDEIHALRAGQVQSILRGDASDYARLCTEDVLLMLQGQDVVVGRPAFVEREMKLFQATRFRSMRQIPLRVERRGEMAVEVGRQELVTAPDSAPSDAFKASRKYSHVLRKTAEGWRFSVLMSNNSV